jgi:uncharacterized membrane protein YeaQ/YmgE (transglycosylase-associated protein family)
MWEIVVERLIYFLDNPVLTLGISVVAGLLAARLACPNRRIGWFVSLIIGLLGFFLGDFVLSLLPLAEFFDRLGGLRVIIDFFAAFFGSFVIAGVIHFIKPS